MTQFAAVAHDGNKGRVDYFKDSWKDCDRITRYMKQDYLYFSSTPAFLRKDVVKMSFEHQKVVISKPRWDGARVLFDIEADGELVPCAISRSALQELSGRRHFASTDLLRCFVGVRGRIEEIAAGKFKARPESVSGIVSIWADDVDDPPSAPAVARQVDHSGHA